MTYSFLHCTCCSEGRTWLRRTPGRCLGTVHRLSGCRETVENRSGCLKKGQARSGCLKAVRAGADCLKRVDSGGGCLKTYRSGGSLKAVEGRSSIEKLKISHVHIDTSEASDSLLSSIALVFSVAVGLTMAKLPSSRCLDQVRLCWCSLKRLGPTAPEFHASDQSLQKRFRCAEISNFSFF